MGMVVRTNTMSANAYRQLGMNNTAVSKSLEKLSSGFRINRAGDDASGLAISEKMKAQIQGLEQASANSQDGISLVQTAEGALTEVHSMLNRMVSLATKSASGTIQNQVDRDAIQTEVDALSTEITRVSQSTNFNGINLLDGSLGGKADGMKATVAGLDITGLSTDIKSYEVTSAAATGAPADIAASVSVSVADGKMTVAYLSPKGAGAALTEAAFKQAFSDAGIKDISYSGTFAAPTAVAATNTTAVVKSAATMTSATTQDGFEINFAKGKSDITSVQLTNSADTETTSNANGVVSIVLDTNKSYTASDVNTMLSDAGVKGITVAFDGSKTAGSIETGLGIETAPKGTLSGGVGNMAEGLTLQVGDTNDSFNKVVVSVDDLSAEGLGIKGLDVSSQTAAGNSIQTIKDAINKVSTNRGTLGALQNRLDYAINNLDTTAENMTSANSRIRDTDMAKEMMTYTKMNILTQAAQAMLAQANQNPQSILQLLQ